MKVNRYGRGHAAYQVAEFLKSGEVCSTVDFVPCRKPTVVAACLRREVKNMQASVVVLVRGHLVFMINTQKVPNIQIGR